MGRDCMVSRDEAERANVRAGRLRDAGPTAVSATYDRRSDRVVVRLSSGIDIGFSPHDTQGWKPRSRRSLTLSKSVRPVWDFTSPKSMPISICRPCWKGSLALSAGWLLACLNGSAAAALPLNPLQAVRTVGLAAGRENLRPDDRPSPVSPSSRSGGRAASARHRAGA